MFQLFLLFCDPCCMWLKGNHRNMWFDHIAQLHASRITQRSKLVCVSKQRNTAWQHEHTLAQVKVWSCQWLLYPDPSHVAARCCHGTLWTILMSSRSRSVHFSATSLGSEWKVTMCCVQISEQSFSHLHGDMPISLSASFRKSPDRAFNLKVVERCGGHPATIGSKRSQPCVPFVNGGNTLLMTVVCHLHILLQPNSRNNKESNWTSCGVLRVALWWTDVMTNAWTTCVTDTR